MISFESVTKTYPGRGGSGILRRRPAEETIAVNNTSFVAPSCHITVLVGPSGCGKTTLLRMVNRMVEPTSGRVLIDDDDVAGLNAVTLRRRVGYVMQHAGLLPHQTVAENIATVPRLNGVDRAERKNIVGEMMELVDLPAELGDRYPGQLSGGQAQRVGVARALATKPNIILMDEPFGAVDPVVRAGLQDQLEKVQAELDTTVLLVTHDMREALRLGHQIVVLGKAGKVVQHGSPQELISSPANDYVADFLGLHSHPLHTVTSADGRRVAVDERGLPVGYLQEPGAGQQPTGVEQPTGTQDSADWQGPTV